MTDFNEICYRAVTEFLTLENVQRQLVHNPMAVVYSEYAPSYAMVKCRAAEFHWGRRSLEDEPRSGCPSRAVCKENCRAVENIVLQNHWVSVGISTGSIKTISSKHLLMTKFCAWWDPWMLDQKIKDCQYEALGKNLKLMRLNWNLFLQCSVIDLDTPVWPWV